MSSLLNIFKGSGIVLQFRLNSQELLLAVLSVSFLSAKDTVFARVQAVYHTEEMRL